MPRNQRAQSRRQAPASGRGSAASVPATTVRSPTGRGSQPRGPGSPGNRHTGSAARSSHRPAGIRRAGQTPRAPPAGRTGTRRAPPGSARRSAAPQSATCSTSARQAGWRPGTVRANSAHFSHSGRPSRHENACVRLSAAIQTNRSRTHDSGGKSSRISRRTTPRASHSAITRPTSRSAAPAAGTGSGTELLQGITSASKTSPSAGSISSPRPQRGTRNACSRPPQGRRRQEDSQQQQCDDGRERAILRGWATRRRVGPAKPCRRCGAHQVWLIGDDGDGSIYGRQPP